MENERTDLQKKVILCNELANEISRALTDICYLNNKANRARLQGVTRRIHGAVDSMPAIEDTIANDNLELELYETET